jgi:exosome complex component RRP42
MIVQKDHYRNLMLKGMRADGRKPDEFRKIDIEVNPIYKAEGSARVRMGETDVIAGVKIDVGTPFPDKLDEGILMVNAEFSPIASPDFEPGPPREEAIELARVIDRGIRESQTIDGKKLCIEKGEKVWMVMVDVHIINHDGNLIDAAGLASIIALHNAKMPEYDGEKVIYDKKVKKLPVKYKPIPVSFNKMGDHLFVDASIEEEEVADTRLTVTMKDDGNIVAIQKGGPEPLSTEEVEKAFETAGKISKDLRKLVK